ncbi:MAG: transposase [Chitinophagaceae bacterium]|nr:MAG: transposase [Chitinophagaceae bacterium]
MSSKYKPGDDAIPHFITFSVVGWVDVFTRELYREIILESMAYCQQQKGMILHAWVIMSNHVHLILSSMTNEIHHIVRDFKKYTSKKIIATVENNPEESRKEWMMNMFRYAASGNNNNKEFQFWKQGYHPVELDTNQKVRQRLDYVHNNPVKAGFVWEPSDYKYSSAIDYYSNVKGLLVVEHL